MGAVKRDAWLAVGSVIAFAIVLFWPMVVGLVTGEPRWFEWDVPEQYWPDLVYLCDALHEGTLPLWNPYDRAGYPYYADPQSGAYHPLNWAICGLAGSSPGPAWADARVVLGFVLAGLFGIGWLREMKHSWSAAIVGAALLMAAPFMRHNWELNLTGAFAWCAAMLWAIERIVQRREVLDGLWLALAVGGCAWVGSPPALWQACTFSALYALTRVWSTPTRSLAAPALIAIVASVGLIGVVIAPGITLSEHSVQAGRSFASIAEGALDDLSAIWVPRPGNHLHVGWIAMSLGVFALVRKRPAVLGAWCLAIVAVAMTLGGTIFHVAFDYVPGVSLFRLPHRYEAWLGPISAIWAAQGLEALRETELPRPPAWAVGLLGLSAGLTLAIFEDTHAISALLLAVGGVLALRHHLETPIFGLALGMLVLLEVTLAMPPERHLRTGPRPGLDTAPLIDATRREWRYVDEFGVSCRSGTRTRHRELRGYQDPLTLRRFSRFLGSMREHPQLAMQLNARWVLPGPHFIHGWNRHFLPPPAELARLPNTHEQSRDTHKRLEFRDALPFAYWVPWEATEQVRDEDSAMDSLKAQAPDRLALLEEVEGIMGVFEGPRRSRFEEIDAYDVELERDSLRFRIDVPSDGVVVVNEAWYPGWKAWVGDQETPIFRANLVVRAIPIKSGSRRVEMRFEPRDRHWRTVWWVSLLVALALLGWRRRTKNMRFE